MGKWSGFEHKLIAIYQPQNKCRIFRRNPVFELLTPSEMAECDRATIAAGTPGILLMERAGAAVARAAVEMTAGPAIVVLAGPGNNGGDGFVAARILRDRGYRITVLLHGERSALRGDAAEASRRFDGIVQPARPDGFARADLIVDALYGAGVRLPLHKDAVRLIEAVNASAAFVLAVDLPSGVEGEGGRVDGVAVRADATVTFFRRKPGHLLFPGRALCGPVTVADIGIGADALKKVALKAFHNVPALWRDSMPSPTADGHKYDRGHLVVVSGAAGRTGAARLAAVAGLRVGAGLVTVASPPEAIPENAAHLTAVMLRPIEGGANLALLLEDARFNSVVLGPGVGVGAATLDLVESALASRAAVVADADALTSYREKPDRLFGRISSRSGATVLTPHEGEFARLFPDLVPNGASKLERARAAAQRSGAVVLLKGADTVVASPDGRAAIADNAPPYLATAGAGDVLAGLIGGLMAQSVPAFEAASAAVWLHGEAASRHGPGLIAEDLAPALAGVLADLR
jgi:hydroxyethylthiazole kinase-like uncharacterized protein yjeF